MNTSKVKLQPLLELANTMKDPTTVRELRQAIKKAKNIYVLPVFGGLDTKRVKISKADALYLVKGEKLGLTAEKFGMYTDSFGFWDSNDLYLG